jgi:hypothetical protein
MRVPDKIRHVIAKTLAKRPEDRYPNVDHLIQELHSLADDWDKLHAPQTPEQILDTLRSSSNVLKESPELPSSPSPLRGTLPITSREPNDGTESAPVTELGTLDPPSPRVYDVQSIDESIPVPSKPSLAPEAPHSPGHPTWIRQRPRSIGSAVLVALASLTLLVMGLLLRRERPSTQVARLAHLDQLCAARSYFSRRDSLPDPTTAPPAIAPPLSVNNRAGFVRRVAASPPSSHPPSRGDGHYVWEYTIRY